MIKCFLDHKSGLLFCSYKHTSTIFQLDKLKRIFCCPIRNWLFCCPPPPPKKKWVFSIPKLQAQFSNPKLQAKCWFSIWAAKVLAQELIYWQGYRDRDYLTSFLHHLSNLSSRTTGDCTCVFTWTTQQLIETSLICDFYFCFPELSLSVEESYLEWLWPQLAMILGSLENIRVTTQGKKTKRFL